MVESLRRLKIDYKLEKANNKTNLIESKEVAKKDITAEDNGAYLVKELQNQIKENKELKESYKAAQEQLSVCYAKEAKYQEMIEKANQSSLNEETINNLNSEIKILKEQLESKEKQLIRTRERCSQLTEAAKKKDTENVKILNESMNSSKLEIRNLTEKLSKEKADSQKQINSLKESLAEAEKNSSIKNNEYSAKIQKAKSIVEKYKTIAQNTLNRYIESKAVMLGVSSDDIKKRLTENYNLDDIDQVCEDLQGYQLALSKLPIVLKEDMNKGSIKVKVTESKEPIRPKTGFDDEVDASLLRMAGLD